MEYIGYIFMYNFLLTIKNNLTKRARQRMARPKIGAKIK